MNSYLLQRCYHVGNGSSIHSETAWSAAAVFKTPTSCKLVCSSTAFPEAYIYPLPLACVTTCTFSKCWRILTLTVYFLQGWFYIRERSTFLWASKTNSLLIDRTSLIHKCIEVCHGLALVDVKQAFKKGTIFFASSWLIFTIL